MAKSNIINDDGTPIALLPSKSDAHYPVKKGKKKITDGGRKGSPADKEFQKRRSTLSL